MTWAYFRALSKQNCHFTVKRELIFLHLHTPLLPAIVPVISQLLNWIFWRWFWRGWDKALPLEGNLPTPSSCSVLFSTVFLFFLLQRCWYFCPLHVPLPSSGLRRRTPSSDDCERPFHAAAPAGGYAGSSGVFVECHWPAPSAELSDLHWFLTLLPGNGTDHNPGTHMRTKKNVP